MQPAKQHLVRNVGSNVLTLAVGMGVGVWQVPYLLDRLGVAAYGQIGILRSIVDYALLAAFSVTWTINRFMAIRINRDDDEGTNAYFNTALFSLAALCAVMVAAALALRPCLPGWIHAPEGLRDEVGWLFVLMMLASCATLLNSPFASVPLARHRFDQINLIKVAGFAIQVVALIACFTARPARLAYVGWAYAFKELGILVAMIWLAHRLFPLLRTGIGSFRSAPLREMAVMSFWSMIDRVGYLLYFSIDLLVINYFLGAVPCGRYAPMTQMAFMLGTFAVAVAHVFWPIAYEHIARGREDDLVRHAQRTTKFMGLILALPVGLLCGLSAPLLTVWLHGAEWALFAPLLVVLVAPAGINFSVRHMFSLTHGLNRVKAPALVTIGGGLLNLTLSIVFVKYTRLGMAGVAVATSIALSLRNLLFVPLYGAAILGRPKSTFYAGLRPGVLASLLIGLAGFWLTDAADLASYRGLALAGGGLVFAHAAVCALLLDRRDLQFIASLLRPGAR